MIPLSRSEGKTLLIKKADIVALDEKELDIEYAMGELPSVYRIDLKEKLEANDERFVKYGYQIMVAKEAEGEIEEFFMHVQSALELQGQLYMEKQALQRRLDEFIYAGFWQRLKYLVRGVLS
jgi:hypothetical protein